MGLADAIHEAVARGERCASVSHPAHGPNYYWLEANGYVNLAPDGSPLSSPGVLIDVKKRRAVEAERDRAAAELRALHETLEQACG